ncbi:hypothetical protein MKW98_021096 [Papaver atlanticum]|uniref:Neprosin PEP catalytic domain-containing protein n=1 Tax=Papaver atlanticum TaxID=357466 RepID=A0AAD4XQX7_9MAGN|nr:hypothetical protein MKW98_021096 [Papaver atlanticum]
MDMMKFAFLLVAIIVFSIHGNSAEARRILSQENQDLEKQYFKRSFNTKPIIKTLRTEEGDIFDCIDIYKQPALDHPSLKNHKIQKRPSSEPKRFSTRSKLTSENPTNSPIKPLECPKGTVPIRRFPKEAKSFFETSPLDIHLTATASNVPGQHVAQRRSVDGAKDAYLGAQALININNPKVGDNQYSAAKIWVEGGPSDHVSTLQAGWAVSSQLLGDNQTRLFVYSNPDVQHEEGCFNLQNCYGFLQVDEKFSLGQAITLVSVYDGDQYATFFTIYQDDVTQHWWLGIGPNPNEVTWFGYWPAWRFPNLKGGAKNIAWGGLVKGTSNGPSPQMGNGEWPSGVFEYAGNFGYLQFLDHASYTWTDIEKSEFEIFVDDGTCYEVQYKGCFGGDQRCTFIYGGPGGDNCGP